MIELDHNATTRPRPEVIEAMARCMAEAWHNPSSVHRAGQSARRAVELARAEVGRLLSAKTREIIFTGSGTESIDLAIRGVLEAARRRSPSQRTLITTRVEHHAVRDLAEHLAETGEADVRWAPVDSAGRVIPGELAELIDDSCALVSVQWANNETGVIQPIERVGEICREARVPFHCDGTQWIGKMPTDLTSPAGAPVAGDEAATPSPMAVARAPFDLLTCSPHKFHGPKGVGILWARRGVPLAPTVRGTQELGRRGGTENVPGIVGAGVAAAEARAWLADPAERDRLGALRDRFEAGVLGACAGAVVTSREADRLWNTTNIGFPRLEAEALLLALSERGLNASAGAACSSGSLEPSPVLLAMGVPPEIAHGSVRFSLGRDTTETEIDRAIGLVAEAVARLAGSSRALGRELG